MAAHHGIARLCGGCCMACGSTIADRQPARIPDRTAYRSVGRCQRAVCATCSSACSTDGCSRQPPRLRDSTAERQPNLSTAEERPWNWNRGGEGPEQAHRPLLQITSWMKAPSTCWSRQQAYSRSTPDACWTARRRERRPAPVASTRRIGNSDPCDVKPAHL